MLVRRHWRLLLAAVVIAVLALGAYVGYLAYRINHDLAAAQDDAAAFKTAVTKGDKAGIRSTLQRLQEHSASAADHADSPWWGLATHVPWLGDDATGVRTAVDVIDDLSQHGLAELAASSTDLHAVVPQHGRIDVDAVTKLHGSVAAGAKALSAADTELGAVDPSGFVRSLRDRYRYLHSEVSSAATALRSADTATQVLPSMLGKDRPQNYLLIVQNNAEVRATGGLPGAVSLLHADNGKLTLRKQVAGKDLGEAPAPVLPLTKAEKAMYGPQLGTYFLDANFTPDFARASDLWKARWEQVEGDKIDGVLSLDPVALSYILDATGPVTVHPETELSTSSVAGGATTVPAASLEPLTITSDNVVKTLLSDVYAKYPPEAQDAVFRVVAGAVFDKVLSSDDNPETLLKALAEGVREHRVYVHSFDDDVQKRLDGTRVAGTVDGPSSEPRVDVTVNDTTGAKMSYYLRYDVDVSSTYCTDGVQGLDASATFKSVAPEDAATSLSETVTGGESYGVPRGTQIETVRVFGPAGGTIDKVTENGKPLDALRFREHDRPIAQFYVQLAPGQTADFAWTMTSGKGQTADTQLRTTPGIEPGRPTESVGSAC